MPLDTRIPMGFQPPQFANPLDMALKGGQLAQLAQQMQQGQAASELNQLKLGQIKSSLEREARMTAEVESLTPEQRSDPKTMTQLALRYIKDPKDVLTFLSKNTMEGLPEIGKLQVLEQRHRAAGNTALADQVANRIRMLNTSETSATQENQNFLLGVRQKMVNGEPVSSSDMAKATLIYKTMTAPRYDAASGQTITPNFGQQFDPERMFGATQRGVAPTDEAALQQVRDATARGINTTVGVAPGAPTPLPIAAAEPRVQLQQVGTPRQTPLTSVARLNADLAAGRITQQQFDSEIARAGAATGEANNSVVQAIVDGRMQMPSGFALRSPYWQQIIEKVAQKDPNFDATRYGARQAARRTFASGPEARNVTSLNTVIGHLGTLDEAAAALENKDVNLQNAVVNRLRTELGDPRVQNFETAKLAVAEELMRVFRGAVGASETEAQAWGQRIRSSGSPAQLRGVIKTAGTLLESRVDAIAQQFERTVNQGGNPASIDPKNRQLLNAIKGNGQQGWSIREIE